MKPTGYQGRQFTPWKPVKAKARRKLSPEVIEAIKAKEAERKALEARLERLVHLTRLATDKEYRRQWFGKYAYRGIGEWGAEDAPLL